MVFKLTASEQITKKVKEILENSVNQHWKQKREYSIIRVKRKSFFINEDDIKRVKLNNNKITTLYCRLSKGDDTDNGSTSISTQKNMLKDYAKRNGFLNCQFYVDDGYSGTNYGCCAFRQFTGDIWDREAMVIELAGRLNFQLPADKEQLSSSEYFAQQISGYVVITELNFKIISTLFMIRHGMTTYRHDFILGYCSGKGSVFYKNLKQNRQ